MHDVSGAGSGSGWRRFAITFALVFLVLQIWSLATPMYGAADENEHMIMAYATVHGSWLGTTDGHGATTFRVPPIYRHGLPCFGLRADQSAACQRLTFHGPDQRISSTAASYPPFYSVLVGWPTLFSSGLTSLYLMRAAAGLWVALLLALAVDSASRLARSGVLWVGLAVAITPVVWFFGATVNPSGLSMAAALAAWIGGFLVVRGPAERLPSNLARFAGPLCLFLLLRRDTFVWGPMIVLALVALAPIERLRQLLASWKAWVWAGAAVVALVLSTVVRGGGGQVEVIGGSASSGSFWGAVANAPGYLQQAVGVLGWLDTQLPLPVYAAFGALAAFLVVGAVCFGPRRLALVTAAVALAAVAAPLLIGLLEYPYFQTRYEVPFAIGLPLVAALALDTRLSELDLRWPRRATLIPLTVIGVAQVLALAQTLRRFSSGSQGTWWFFHAPAWTPPHGGLSGLVVLMAVATAALYGWWWHLATTAGSISSPGDQPDRWPRRTTSPAGPDPDLGP